MKRCFTWSLSAVALAGAASLTFLPVSAQTRATSTNVPVIPHEAVPNFFKNPPGIYTGENMGIATNSKGNIYIYHRANETRLFEYNAAGDLRPRDWPEQLRLLLRALRAGRRAGQHLGGRRRHRHARQVQPRRQSADGASDGARIRSPCSRTCPGGASSTDGTRSTASAGRPMSPSISRATSSCPTATSTRRVVKYDKNGKFVKAVGKRGNANLEFNTPHSIATDFQGNVYVGDRGNARVQVLDNDLNWKANYTNVGNPWGVCVSGGPGPKNPGKQYLYSTNSWPDSAPAAAAEFTGEIYKMELDGTIVGKFGRAARRRANSRPPTRWTAAIRTSSTPRKSTTGARRRSCSSRRP